MMMSETGQNEATKPTTTTPAVYDDTSGGGGGGGGSGSGGFSEDERGRFDDGGRSSGGNRWPKQETLALLKIRSDMDIAFRDSSLKGPLWDEVSRKLAELGFHRSAKKCKEKFENVYKYHKRTKEGRTSKADGKTYRFFDQLQALEGTPAAVIHHQTPLSPPPPPPHHPQIQAQAVSRPPQVSPMSNSALIPSVPMIVTHQNNVDPISVAAPAAAMPSMVGGFPFSQLNISASTDASDSSTSSDDEPERRRSRKRKWKEFFGKLMKEVVDKQEELQARFIDTLERRERDRVAREEAWRVQEMAKMKREHELLVQERSMAAAKDAAVISFLQKISEQNPNSGIHQMPAMQLLQQQQNHPLPHLPPPQSAPSMQPQPQQPPQQPQKNHTLPHLPPPQSALMQQHSQQPQPQVSTAIAVPVASVPGPVPIPAIPPPLVKNLDNSGGDSGVVGENMLQPSPSRWPKAEINALIRLRTTLDTKYQENGPKGPLWEEISSAMRNLGYNRNAKRCKEKWENINKYYKKVKESSKKRPEDSKTCPYFHQLDAIYREKAGSSSITSPGSLAKPETAHMAPIMARPEQQWPLPAVIQHQHQNQNQNLNQQQQIKTNEPTRNEVNPNADEDDYDDDEEEDDEEEEGGEFEMVQNKTSSMATN